MPRCRMLWSEIPSGIILEPEIQQRQIGSAIAQPGQGRRAGGKRTDDRVAAVVQRILEGEADGRVVLGEKDLGMGVPSLFRHVPAQAPWELLRTGRTSVQESSPAMHLETQVMLGEEPAASVRASRTPRDAHAAFNPRAKWAPGLVSHVLLRVDRSRCRRRLSVSRRGYSSEGCSGGSSRDHRELDRHPRLRNATTDSDPDRSGRGGRRAHDMRCYFHLVSAHEIVPDTSGIDVVDEHVAYAEACRAIQELCDEVDAEDWTGWVLEAVDETGTRIFAVQLDSRDFRPH